MAKTNNFELSQLVCNLNEVSLSQVHFLPANGKLLKDESFIFRDDVTRNKYQVEELKKSHKYHKSDCSEMTFTEKAIQESDQMMYLLKEINFLRNIKINRNQMLSKAAHKRNSRLSKLSSIHSQVQKEEEDKLQQLRRKQKLTAKIRMEMSLLNHQHFREYLSNGQIFRPEYSKLERTSTLGNLNINKIKEIKNLLQNCANATLPIVSEVPKQFDFEMKTSKKGRKVLELAMDKEVKQADAELKAKMHCLARDIFADKHKSLKIKAPPFQRSQEKPFWMQSELASLN